MRQVSGPVIAVGLVLSAVFLPCAFIAGITGQFFRQFALTIAVSTLISAFNSLTLSPALAAMLLKPRDKEAAPPLPTLAFPLIGAWLGWEFLAHPMNGLLSSWTGTITAVVIGAVVLLSISRPVNWLLGTVFRWFNKGFHKATTGYVWLVGRTLRVSAVVLVLYAGLLLLTWVGFTITPKGFIPAQDKGYLLVNVQLPDSASVHRTETVMREVEAVALRTPGVKHTVGVAGQSLVLNANAPNFGSLYVMLDDFEHRTDHELHADAIAERLREALHEEIATAQVNVFGAPPLEGLGTTGGFKVVVQDRGDLGPKELQQVADDVVLAGRAHPDLRGLYTSFRANTPWLYLDIDRTQAQTMGVSMGEVFNVLQVYLGSLYVNDFNRFGRTWQVNAQAAQDYRRQIEDLRHIQVRNDQGKMVQLGTFASVKDTSGPVLVMRYNMYPAAAVNVTPAPGVSSGQAIDQTEAVVREEMPRQMRLEWTELALLQLQTGNTAMLVFLLAVILVFLVLAAQYESWSLPLAVILVVPMCLLCSVAGVLFAKLDVNIFTQVGFVVLVGLACKNAILIVEFAKARREAGDDATTATLEACKLRLRPIIMTSLAFILGVVPLVLAEGAGAEMRRTLGVAVFSGMLGVTLFGIFLTPVFYFVIQWIQKRCQEPFDIPMSKGS
jgi:hydrophobe/amphiphile efflux-1 (HAE1) family protein